MAIMSALCNKTTFSKTRIIDTWNEKQVRKHVLIGNQYTSKERKVREAKIILLISVKQAFCNQYINE